MFGLSFAHILILSVIVLLFGGRRLPELGSALGRGLRAFKNGLEGGSDLQNDSNHLAKRTGVDAQVTDQSTGNPRTPNA